VAIVMGNLGNTPTINYTKDNDPVSNFNVATNKVYVNKKGEKIESTTWHKMVAWGKLAQYCANNLKKGDFVHITGEIRIKQSVDENGNRTETFEIVANRVIPIIRSNKENKPEN